MQNQNFVSSANAKRSNSGSRSRVPNTFLDILKRYRELYQRSWCNKSTDTKNKALKRAITERATEIYTRDVFLQEFARRVDVLLDSKHFCDAVKGLIPPLDPYNVATHIVVLGDKELKRILLEGGYKDLKPFPEWKEPILKKEVLCPILRILVMKLRVRNLLRKQSRKASQSKLLMQLENAKNYQKTYP